MSRYDRECPACGRMISPRQVPVWESGGFPCPDCSQLLRTNTSSLKWAWLITLFVTIGICLLAGVRNSIAIVVLLMSAVPLSFVTFALFSLVSPAQLELVPIRRRPETSRVQLHLARFDKKCPACGEVIPASQIPTWQSRGFPCPACAETLKSSNLPVNLILPSSFAASLLLCITFGLRGFTMIFAALGAMFPMYLVVYAILGLISPPGLEIVPKTNLRLDR